MEHGIDNARFGVFVAALRRERQLTQRQLADRIGVSDKAVSKWERGLSLPDIALLEPLADALGVTVAELLHGERLDAPLPPGRVDALVSSAVQLGQAHHPVDPARRRRWLGLWCGAVGAAAVEALLLGGVTGRGVRAVLGGTGGGTAGLVLGLGALLGLLFCFLEDRLPAYYDDYAVPGYLHGAFHIRLPGVRFTNRNWLAVRRAGFGVLLGLLVGYLPLAAALEWLCPALPPALWSVLALGLLLVVLFGAMTAAALRHADPPASRAAWARALAWPVVLLALIAVLLGGGWATGAVSGSGSQLLWLGHRTDAGWTAQYLSFTGTRTLQISGTGVLDLCVVTRAGALTVTVADTDGTVLLCETTDTDAAWQLDAPAAVRLTLEGRGHSGQFTAQYAG